MKKIGQIIKDHGMDDFASIEELIAVIGNDGIAEILMTAYELEIKIQLAVDYHTDQSHSDQEYTQPIIDILT